MNCVYENGYSVDMCPNSAGSHVLVSVSAHIGRDLATSTSTSTTFTLTAEQAMSVALGLQKMAKQMLAQEAA